MHGCMPGRISVQNTARCTVPRPLFLHSMHARQSARTIIVRRNAGRLLFHPCRACTNGFTACASKGGISPCLVHPPARLVLALLQHARVSACPGSALLGTAAMRALHGAARSRDGRLRALHRVRSALPVPSLQILHQRQHACMAACPGAELPRTQHAVLSRGLCSCTACTHGNQRARSSYQEMRGVCCSTHAEHAPTACASKGGISPRLVRPSARPVLALLQHARVAACQGSALLGTAAMRARNGAARASDGRLQPAPATDGRTQSPRWSQPGSAIDGRARALLGRCPGDFTQR
jgi:hypothetical protein